MATKEVPSSTTSWPTKNYPHNTQSAPSLVTPQPTRLAKRVEVVQGDTTTASSLSKALKNVHTVFAMTIPSFSPSGLNTEIATGKRIADAAVAQGCQYMVFSTLPAVSQISSGKYTMMTPFDSKAVVEEYIRGLPIQSAFYSPGGFIENFQSPGVLAPQRVVERGEEVWVMRRNVSAEAKVGLIDASGDTGKFIGAILAKPDEYEGKVFCAAQAFYTNREIVDIMSKTTGKKVVFQQVSTEAFRESLSFLP